MAPKRTILIVDDSESIREAVSFELERSGYSVLKAVDGKDALSVMKDSRIDLLLTDLHMPVMNGLELIRVVRKTDGFRNIPILFLTTETQQALLEEAKRSGATGWITKPFNAEKLIKTVKKVIH
jgi:two-component system chemotaxis response regulator CheY